MFQQFVWFYTPSNETFLTLYALWHTIRERLPFLTPGSAPPPHFGTCLCSYCWDQISRTCHAFSRLFTSNIPWYFLDFAWFKDDKYQGLIPKDAYSWIKMRRERWNSQNGTVDKEVARRSYDHSLGVDCRCWIRFQMKHFDFIRPVFRRDVSWHGDVRVFSRLAVQPSDRSSIYRTFLLNAFKMLSFYQFQMKFEYQYLQFASIFLLEFGCPYIFLIYYYITIYVCVPHFYKIFLWPLRFGWLLVLSLYKEDYLQFFQNVCPFDCTAVAVSEV